ncbi:hypothetical protein NKR23_g3113 [Pleurostoma richardsiae]|uniref:Uncharacterized protein n=1 Tax=Pleurostoma richardsiae TaxID=41990 RepID=A0AA38S008_9PEZI|nr:hypothetical protein NKR23_g3113 [Pleurostoma richardsiae]
MFWTSSDPASPGEPDLEAGSGSLLSSHRLESISGPQPPRNPCYHVCVPGAFCASEVRSNLHPGNHCDEGKETSFHFQVGDVGKAGEEDEEPTGCERRSENATNCEQALTADQLEEVNTQPKGSLPDEARQAPKANGTGQRKRMTGALMATVGFILLKDIRGLDFIDELDALEAGTLQTIGQ